MAIALPARSYAGDEKIFSDAVRIPATEGARLLRQGFDALAQAIDLSLTVVFLLTDLVLAASLAATAAGFALAPPH